uniref:Transcription factor Adf-1 n=1 Tax=Zeugodacus cucurbitae TaxID=28588 RepID=A0A0A1X6J8_ZEUCU
MDALRASIAFASPVDAYSANSRTTTRTPKKSSTAASSLRSSPASSPNSSPKAVNTAAATIAPPSPTHSSGASSCSSSRSRLRVATPDSDTPDAGAGGGEVEDMSVSGGSQLGAALDMKTKGSAAASVAAAAAAAAVELLQGGAPTSQMQSQKIKKLVRRNASDKLRLIQMVHDNPILWDSRLPNFKGAEEEKNRAWEMIGKEFNAPGRRVARAFKSLRESYRRELAHVKLMGNGFKPKWSLYEAMDFLRDVIRERKGGSHAAEQAAIGLNLSAFSQHLNNNNNNSGKSALKLNGLHSSFNESALNLSKCAPGLNMSHEDYYYYVKSEMDLNAAHAGSNGIGGGNAAVSLHPLPAHQAQQQQQQLHSAAHDSRVSSTRNDSTTQHSNTFDDLDASSVRSGDEASMRNADMSNQGSDEVEELEAIDADFPYPLILDANSPRSMSAAGGNGNIGGNAVGGSGALKRKRRDLNGDGMDDGAGDDDDDYEGQMMQQHRHLRQQNGGMGGGGSGSGMNGCMLDMPPPQTVREVLNSKFCGFISAKLNSMEDTEADNLMNKILMLLVQTQTNEAK